MTFDTSVIYHLYQLFVQKPTLQKQSFTISKTSEISYSQCPSFLVIHFQQHCIYIHSFSFGDFNCFFPVK